MQAENTNNASATNVHQSQNLSSQMKSPNFFKLSGIPKFGKNWLDNFIDDEDMQNTFLTSEVVRNVVMLQCVFYASVYNDLLLYKQAYLMQKDSNGSNHTLNDNTNDHQNSTDAAQRRSSNNQTGMQNHTQSQSLDQINDLPAFKVGIIGCGHIGTMILTKLLEIAGSFNNLKVMVSTRQPHLLRPFQQEFQVEADFNNERIVAECDLIFLCILPQQANQVLKEIRPMTLDRYARANKNKNVSKPLFVSCMAAIGIQKLKLLLAEEATFMRTQINVMHIKEYLIQQQQPQLIDMISKKPDQKQMSSTMMDNTGGNGGSQTNQHSLKKHTATSLTNHSQQEDDQNQQQSLRESASASVIQAIANRSSHGQNDEMDDIPDKQSTSQRQNHLMSHNGSLVKKGSKLAKVLSHKALKIGMESGVTAEYIVRQTCEQLVQKLVDLFVLFDTYQESLYSNDPIVQNTQDNTEVIAENNKVMYEESILMTLLGPDYMQFISEETGEWTNESEVLEKFYELFDTRIRYIFDADDAENEEEEIQSASNQQQDMMDREMDQSSNASSNQN